MTTELHPHGEAENAARSLVRGHYENFSVGGIFLSRRDRQDLFNIYAFSRIADDFADELSDPAAAALKLEAWERELDAAVAGSARKPVLAALGETISRRRLNVENFRRLLQAFRIDLVKMRYETWDELNDYTRLSADPVGRIVLELFGYHNPAFFALSDKICTALQLANHWQDIATDFRRGRIYIPLVEMRRFGVDEAEIANTQASDGFLRLMRYLTQRARSLFDEGKPLILSVRMPLRLQLALYWQGGTAALDAIERIGFDVLTSHARLSRLDKAKVALEAARMAFLNA